MYNETLNDLKILLTKNAQILAGKQSTNEQEEFVLNTNLALSFANEIIKRFRKTENKSEDFKIIIPKSSSTKAYEDQLVTLIKELNDSFKNENKKILLLAISHILFLLEKYSEIIANKKIFNGNTSKKTK